MKALTYRFLAVIAIFAATLALTSCDDDGPYYNSPYVGQWSLQAIDGYPISEAEACTFAFYDNGFGTYSSYNAAGYWTTVDIDWDISVASGGAEYLTVYTPMETWVYIARFSHGGNGLILTDTQTGQVLTFAYY